MLNAPIAQLQSPHADSFKDLTAEIVFVASTKSDASLIAPMTGARDTKLASMQAD